MTYWTSQKPLSIENFWIFKCKSRKPKAIYKCVGRGNDSDGPIWTSNAILKGMHMNAGACRPIIWTHTRDISMSPTVGWFEVEAKATTEFIAYGGCKVCTHSATIRRMPGGGKCLHMFAHTCLHMFGTPPHFLAWDKMTIWLHAGSKSLWATTAWPSKLSQCYTTSRWCNLGSPSSSRHCLHHEQVCNLEEDNILHFSQIFVVAFDISHAWYRLKHQQYTSSSSSSSSLHRAIIHFNRVARGLVEFKQSHVTVWQEGFNLILAKLEEPILVRHPKTGAPQPPPHPNGRLSGGVDVVLHRCMSTMSGDVVCTGRFLVNFDRSVPALLKDSYFMNLCQCLSRSKLRAVKTCRPKLKAYFRQLKRLIRVWLNSSATSMHVMVLILALFQPPPWRLHRRLMEFQEECPMGYPDYWLLYWHTLSFCLFLVLGLFVGLHLTSMHSLAVLTRWFDMVIHVQHKVCLSLRSWYVT